ncbi:MAG: TlpA family protein disulfide reductase, partial [Spirochaetota bacterium]|nr:TlpA family protein disulfide reductase [Spirochaetota bacterium]
MKHSAKLKIGLLTTLSVFLASFGMSDTEKRSSHGADKDAGSPGYVLTQAKDRSCAAKNYRALKKELKKIGFQVASEHKLAPDFKMKDINGKPVSLKDYRGKLIFLNFWATWCPPCRREMPSMQSLNSKMKGKNFVMLAVSDESMSTVQRYARAKSFNFPILIGSAIAAYRLQAIPTTYIIDPQGYILGHAVGGRTW